jgi:hypothetical protein
MAYCSNPAEDTYIRYNLGTGRIERLAYHLHNVTLGQVIAAYGQPIGANVYSTFAYVYYKDCYVVIYAERLSPLDKVDYVAWDISAVPVSMGRWEGFVN